MNEGSIVMLYVLMHTKKKLLLVCLYFAFTYIKFYQYKTYLHICNNYRTTGLFKHNYIPIQCWYGFSLGTFRYKAI